MRYFRVHKTGKENIWSYQADNIYLSQFRLT